MGFIIARRFLPLAFLAAALCGLVYIVGQQMLRQAGNNPQIEIAEATAAQISAGGSILDALPAGVASTSVDIANSLTPYVVLFDRSGAPLAGNGILNGSLAKLPAGVFEYAAAHGEDRITWQPMPGVRQAAVVVAVSNPNSVAGFVVAGRSLRAVEALEDQLGYEVGGALLFIIGGLLLLEIILALIETPHKKRR